MERATAAEIGLVVGGADQEPGSSWCTRDAVATRTRARQDLPDMHRLFPGAGTIWAVGKSGSVLRYDARERGRGQGG